jgi:hypothetical protein
MSGPARLELEGERAALCSLAIGRLLRVLSRPYQPGDDAEYQRCRGIILDNSEPQGPDRSASIARDYGKGAAGQW